MPARAPGSSSQGRRESLRFGEENTATEPYRALPGAASEGIPGWRDRIIINCELGGMGNDYFMVPRVQLAMRLFGLDKETGDRVCFRTPRDFFRVPVG
jgi:predicted metal-dependent TIM-barrel fold hydrolase